MSISRRLLTSLACAFAFLAGACGASAEVDAADHFGGAEANQAEIDAALAELTEISTETAAESTESAAESTESATNNGDPGQHSLLISFHSDGLPVYGPLDVDGQPPTDLDECSGHVGPTPDADRDTYHYHVLDGQDPASIEAEGCGR